MKKRSPQLALQWFGFRQALKGAIIIGLLAGFMVFLQGVGYAETYPDKTAQDRFAAEMSSVPSLGILYGSADNLSEGVHGYIVYRVVAFMSLIIAVWGLMAVTKLLRGSEEDGRWEIIRSGKVTARASTLYISLGFMYAFLASFILGTLLIVLVARLPDINMNTSTALLVSCALFSPAMVFIGIGIFVSQLAITRRRALLYGLIPIAIAYFIRSLGNINPDLHDLLYYTPFGWNMLINPVLAPNSWWLGILLMCAVIFFTLGIILSKRDLGSSIIPESTKVTSRFYLLKQPWQLALRQNVWVYVAWGILSIAMGVIVASILDVATNATASSSTLSQAVEQLAGTSKDLRLAFLGAGIIFVVLVLLILAAVLIGSIRNDEAKQYLETILVQPKKRSWWLISRLLLNTLIIFTISFTTMALIYFAAPANLPLEFAKLAALSVAMLGSVLFLTGVGTLVYGILPRIGTFVMYGIITWSFIIDLVSSVIKMDELILQTSLFHYMTFNVSEWPDWNVFMWLTGLGIAMAAIGVIAFCKRDIIAD